MLITHPHSVECQTSNSNLKQKLDTLNVCMRALSEPELRRLSYRDWRENALFVALWRERSISNSCRFPFLFPRATECQTSISNLKQTLDTLDVHELCLSLSWGWATEIGEKMLFLLHFEESNPSAILVVSHSYSPVLLNIKLQSQILNKL